MPSSNEFAQPRKPRNIASVFVLFVLFISLALVLEACQRPQEPAAENQTSAPLANLTTPSPTPEPSQSIDSSTEQGISDIPPSPTAQPSPERVSVSAAIQPQSTSTRTTQAIEGQRVVLRPRPADVGWWSNTELRGHIGDSFLYAGQADNRTFIAAIRFDLDKVPRAAVVRSATLRLYGLREDRLNRDDTATWTVQFIDPDSLPNFVQATFQQLFNAPAAITLLPSLGPNELGEGVVNTWELDPSSRVYLSFALAAGKSAYIARITGPTSRASENLFAWDSGNGPRSLNQSPRLELVLGPAPLTPPSSPTPTPIVATATPTPENILTVAAQAATATAFAETVGTYTPTPPNLVTPTPIAANIATVEAIALFNGFPPVVVHTPTPANPATATAQAMYATAVALTTGTFTPVPPDAVTPFVITPTPIPENVLTAVAQRASPPLTLETPLPYNAVLATLTPTPWVVTATPTPENQATRTYLATYATAVALTTGTFTPTPENVVVVTPTPAPRDQAIPLVQFLDELTPTPTPTPEPSVPSALPAYFTGKILFFSNRDGNDGLFLLDPSNGRLARVNATWPYKLAQEKETRSPDGRHFVVVRNDHRGIPEVYIYSPEYNSYRLLTTTTGMSYDPVWSPTGEWIAFVSQETGNDEIFIIRPDGTEMRQLTRNSWEWDKHPSWSPDGTQIVFWSNRDTGRPQLWIMNSDGSGQRRLLDSPFDDRDPIWVK